MALTHVRHPPSPLWPQDEPFPLLLERQSNPVGGWDEAAAAQMAARGGDAAFQRAAAEALAEARQVWIVAIRELNEALRP